MQYYCNNKNIEKEKLEYLSSGEDTDVYKNEELVFKIFKTKPYISKEDCEYMIQVSKESNRILLPKDIIYNQDGEYSGYTSKYIKTEQDNYGIVKMNKKILIKNYLSLINNSALLGRNKIKVNDIEVHNMIVSNMKIYVVDFSRYRLIKSTCDINSLSMENMHKIDMLFTKIITSCTNSRQERDHLLAYMYEYCGNKLGQFIINIDDHSNIENELERIKRKI